MLIVDDEFSLVETLAEILTYEGYEVVTASDGAQALALAEKIRPALMLLDHMMPVLNGLQTLQRLRASSWGANLPVIMMTAAPVQLPADQRQGVPLLRKPFEIGQLVRLVAEAIGPADWVPDGSAPSG